MRLMPLCQAEKAKAVAKTTENAIAAHAQNTPACRPLQAEREAQEQAPHRGGGEDETGVGGAGQADAEGEGGLGDGDAEAAQPQHREHVASSQPALRLQQPEHEQEQQPPDGEPERDDH